MLMKQFKPMLAASLVGPSDPETQLEQNLREMQWPVLATPKLDGIRCTTLDDVTPPDQLSVPVCRSLKSVPNDFIRRTIGEVIPWLDGEILTYDQRDLLNDIVRPRDFHRVQSDVMQRATQPAFKFHVFDMDVCGGHNYADRVKMLEQEDLPSFCVKVLPTQCNSAEELHAFMGKCIANGHEGCCFRQKLYSPYKYGRSTLRQGWLVKWKLFATSEATIVGFEEEMHNANEATTGLLGQTQRSSHQVNMVGKGRLGALVCDLRKSFSDVLNAPRDDFKIGTGFTAQQRQELWADRDNLIGKFVTFKHQPHGAKEAPRIPVFIGIRSKLDIS